MKWILCGDTTQFMPRLSFPKGHSGRSQECLLTTHPLSIGVDPAQAYWEIREGVSQGNNGTLVASGTSAALYSPTGRSLVGFFEFTTLVKGINVPLQAGTYWLSVVPECTNTNDYNCKYARIL